MSHEFEAVNIDNDGLSTKQKLTVAFGLLLVASLTMFVVQNSDDTEVQWLMFDATLPKWLIITISAVVGAALVMLASAVIKRRSRGER
jgi:uncharacterized integral membrane protein